jgi:hypothetical protein
VYLDKDKDEILDRAFERPLSHDLKTVLNHRIPYSILSITSEINGEVFLRLSHRQLASDPGRSFRFIYERKSALSMEMSFFGMLLYILGVCPENRDESKGNSIVKLWLQFIPIFGALDSQLDKGHTKKTPPCSFHIQFFRRY